MSIKSLNNTKQCHSTSPSHFHQSNRTFQLSFVSYPQYMTCYHKIYLKNIPDFEEEHKVQPDHFYFHSCFGCNCCCDCTSHLEHIDSLGCSFHISDLGFLTYVAIIFVGTFFIWSETFCVIIHYISILFIVTLLSRWWVSS